MTRYLQRVASALGSALQRLDAILRTWAVAGLALLLLLLALAVSMLLER